MLLSALIIAAIYTLHQDFWFWRTARPLVFGFLPIGLFYHAAYTLALSVLFAWLVRRHWPVLSEVEGPVLSDVERPTLDAPRSE